MKNKRVICLSICLLSLAFPFVTAMAAPMAHDNIIHITILHFNDVYEITPVAGGTRGGLARVATLKKQVLAENPNTILLFGGDLYFPSGLGTAKVDGEPLNGKHAVAVMNKVGVDYMAFGDHEFDIPENQFIDRLSETRFPIISGNVFDKHGKPFPGTIVNDIIKFSNARGDSVKVGLFSVTEPLPKAKFDVKYVEAAEALKEQVNTLKDKVDVLIGLTHFTLKYDIEFAKNYPEIDLIFGGDDHEKMKEKAGDELATIYKADSNARSVYRVDLYYIPEINKFLALDELIEITDKIPSDPATEQVSKFWEKKAFDAFKAAGIDPEKVIATPNVEMDGYGSSVRNHATHLTDVIGAGMLAADAEAEGAIYMSGFIRFDDLMPAGSPFTAYDAIRCLPLNDPTAVIELDGASLKALVKKGEQNKARGEYLLRNNISGEGDDWSVGGAPLDEGKTYKLAVNKRLLQEYSEIEGKFKIVRESKSLQESLILGMEKSHPSK